ncbi:GlcG/HbpS family heme-binding protein [Falsiroseomonas oryzae]|uniref:GlcG/HbpS family heme-binding protein n=1 Tax=Falsiroseomonas oryzae TaxID=2766473 RepID=UPI0022EA3047|nr:heme-binding protein [Roseomonas sp. MO-31]
MTSRWMLPALVAASLLPAAGQAQGVIAERNISTVLAVEAAQAAVAACAERNFRVAATVVDRHGIVKAVVRADGAGPHTVDASRGKAYTSASARNPTTGMLTAVRENPAAQTLPNIPGFLVLGGGVPIRAGEEVVGAIGVGGAPSGVIDEECANAAIARIRDRLN